METMIYDIVLDYVNKKVTNDIKDEFINAAVHFNINNDIYKKYSSVEIECILSKVSNNNLVDYIELCSVCGYILYRLIENNELNDEDRIEALQIVLEISNGISNYLRSVVNEDELYEKLLTVTTKLNLSKEQSENIIKLINI